MLTTFEKHPVSVQPGQEAILVVDDAAIDRRLAGRIIAQKPGWVPLYAENGAEALQMVRARPPRMVLTDLQMPEMDGLQLVDEMRTHFPQIPVVLMTNQGSEEIALEALRRGAASYVPKRNRAQKLAETIEQVLDSNREVQDRQDILMRLAQRESRFQLENEPRFVPPLTALFRDEVVGMGLCDRAAGQRLAIALQEAILNAIYHGNLEITSAVMQKAEGTLSELVHRRKTNPSFQRRRVHIIANLAPEQAIYVVRDEGPGFDPSTLPDPVDPHNLDRPHGRGLLLIRTFMDRVSFNSLGNQITMVKYRNAATDRR